MFSGMVEPTGDPTTLKKEERAMRPTPEVVWKWSSKLNYAKRDKTTYKCVFILPNLRRFQSIQIKSDTIEQMFTKFGQILADLG